MGYIIAYIIAYIKRFLYLFLRKLKISYDNDIMGTEKQVNISFDPWIRDAIEQLRDKWKINGKKPSISSTVNEILEIQLEKMGYSKGRYTAKNRGLSPETGETPKAEYERLVAEFKAFIGSDFVESSWPLSKPESFGNKADYSKAIEQMKIQIAAVERRKDGSKAEAPEKQVK
jgi:hypothetical protein